MVSRESRVAVVIFAFQTQQAYTAQTQTRVQLDAMRETEILTHFHTPNAHVFWGINRKII